MPLDAREMAMSAKLCEACLATKEMARQQGKVGFVICDACIAADALVARRWGAFRRFLFVLCLGVALGWCAHRH